MRNKIASSFMLALALAGTLVLPSMAADDDTFAAICRFPWRVAGSAVGTAVGVPEGIYKDSVKGAIMSTKWAAGKLGDENGTYQTWWGAMFAGPFGTVGGGAYGAFDGAWHGLKTGYDKPFSKDAFTFKDE